MPQVRKPIPKTQQQLGNEQVVPTYQQAGNPNNFNPSPTENRALQTSFKGDTVKPFSVGLQDIDEAIFYYFGNVIQPSVIQNGARLPVPIIYGSPEKWKSYQKDGYYRDQNGKIQAPLIMFKRNSIDKNRQIANKLDANNPQNFGVFTKRYTQRNAYDNFKVLNIPLVEAMEYASDAYWGDPQRYQFKAMIDSFGFQTELVENDERIVRSTFDIKINGYIIPDILQKDITALKKFSNKTKIIFGIETTDNTDIIEGNVVGDRIIPNTPSNQEASRRINLVP